MPSYYWFKLYDEILNDPKMGKMPDRLYRRAIEMMAFANQFNQDGKLPPVDDMAWVLRCDESELRAEMQELASEKYQILTWDGDDCFVTKFLERQGRVSSTERTRQQRQRDREKGVKREYWRKAIYENLPEEPGIYKIHCTATKKSYIGSAKNIKKRVKAQLSNIDKNDHPMAVDIIAYGKETVQVEVLEVTVFEENLPETETKWINCFSQDELYNREFVGKGHRDRSANNENRPSVWDVTGTKRPIDIESESEKESDKSRREQTSAREPEKVTETVDQGGDQAGTEPEYVDLDEDRVEDDDFTRLQHALEQVIGLPIVPGDIPPIQEMIKIGVTRADIQGAAEWMAANGKTIRYAGQLYGPVRVQVAKRKQEGLGRGDPPGDGKAFARKQPKNGREDGLAAVREAIYGSNNDNDTET